MVLRPNKMFLRAEEIPNGVSGSCYIRREVSKLVYLSEE